MAIAITLAEYDMATGRLLRLVAEPYSGPWALCKNENSKKVTKEAISASKDAQVIAKSQLAISNALVNKDEAAFKDWLNGQGFSTETEAMMLSNFRNSVSQQYGSALAQVKQTIASRGGYQAGGFGGTDVGRIAGFEANQARTMASGQLGLKLYAEQQNADRKKFAGSLYGVLAGTQAQTATGFGNIGANYLGTGAQAARTADSPSPLWGVLNAAIAGGANMGAVALAKCWIAESIYGTTAWQTHLLRHWLNDVWAERSIIGRATMWVYGKVGRWVARQPLLVVALRPLFDVALACAMRDCRVVA
jgi:hypothetical protein